MTRTDPQQADFFLTGNPVSQAKESAEQAEQNGRAVVDIPASDAASASDVASGSDAFYINGRYRVGPLLGQGGMGVVYLVFDLLRQRDLALKMMHPWMPLEDQKQLARELSLHETLSHEGIVRTHDLGTDQQTGRLFFTMEYIAGRSLENLLETAMHEGRCPPLEVEELRQWFWQLSASLEVAHRKGIVHRDLKPSNVLIDIDGNARLLDFGIAKQITHKTTHHTAFVGTAVYMAPEQLKGSTKVSPAADVYALGAMLYQMLTGEFFYGRMPGPSELLRERGIPLSFPALVDRILLRALEVQPERRYQDAGEFRRALDWAMSGIFLMDKREPSEPALFAQGRVVGEPGAFGTRTLRLQGEEVNNQTLERLRYFQELDKLDLSESAVTSHGLRRLQSCTELRVLRLKETKVDDDGLRYLRFLTQLEELDLESTNLFGRGLGHLKLLTRLRRLNLWGTQIRDWSLKQLSTLEIEHLRLGNTAISDQGLLHLQEMGSLLCLDLSWTQITNAGLGVLRRLEHLRSLELSWTDVQNAGLVHLKSIPELQELNLRGTDIDDGAVESLVALRTLHKLDLRATLLTKKGVGELQGRLPLCYILYEERGAAGRMDASSR